MIADIAGAAGREKRIGQGVQGDIRIGMAGELAVMRYEHAAKRDAVALDELMHVITVAGAHIRDCVAGQPFIGHRNILLKGELHIVRRPFDEHHRDAGPFGDGSVVGKVAPAAGICGAVGGEDRLEAEALRRLGGIEAAPGHRLLDKAAVWRPFQRVGDGGCRKHRLRSAFERRAAAVEQGVVDEGTHGVLDHRVPDARLGERLDTGKNRELPRRTAVNHRHRDRTRHPLECRGEKRLIVRMDDDDDRSDARPCRENVKRMGDNGAIADRSVLLWPFRRLAGALAAAGRDDDDATGELFFRLHFLYGVPQFSNLRRHVPRRPRHCQPSVHRAQRRPRFSGYRQA